MLRTLPITRDYTWTQRLAMILIFTALTALSAQVKIYFGSPVPFTLQPLVVLLAGMTLGARDGFFAIAFYIGFIALGFPIDASGNGAAALSGATAGYLIGFLPAAFVAGFLVEHGANRLWQRWLAGVAGIAIIYVCGVVVLKLVTGMDWSSAWLNGVAPFIGADLLKAVIASALSEGTRASLLRWMN